jgi:hypothetical protein
MGAHDDDPTGLCSDALRQANAYDSATVLLEPVHNKIREAACAHSAAALRSVRMRTSRVLLPVLTLCFGALLTSATLSAQTKTAQSAMFENTAAGTFVVTGSEVWAYDTDAAAGLFSNVLLSGPTVACSGSPANCATTNQPAAPAAPAASASKVNPFVHSNSCNLWDGLALTLNPLPQDNQYTQPLTIPGLNGNGNWKFTWTYQIGFADTVGGPYPAQTAWTLQSTDTTNATVSIEGFFAGQSTQAKSNGTGGWSFKASHTMLDSLGASRLVGAQATITDADANVKCALPIVIENPIQSNQDFTYLGNAGRNGTTANLFDDGVTSNGTVNEIQGAVSIALNGKKDDFAGNNGTGGDKAVIDSVATGTCSIGVEGSYTLSVTGTLKGVSGASSLPVSVSSQICVSAGTCQVCN